MFKCNFTKAMSSINIMVPNNDLRKVLMNNLSKLLMLPTQIINSKVEGTNKIHLYELKHKEKAYTTTANDMFRNKT